MDAPAALLVGIVVALAVGIVVGAVAATLVARSRAAASVAAAAARAAAADATTSTLRDQLDRHAAEAARQRRAELEQSRVLEAIAPVRDTLRTMQERLQDLEAQRQEQHGQLAQQLRSASDSEERLRRTTEQLASALRNNSTRGVWGETQLRSLVESAGLLNRVDFLLQGSIEAETGARRPDLILRLPGGKSIAVDAKVPYSDYIEASAISATADGEAEARRTALLVSHARTVRSHVDALGAKQYWTGLSASPEFTIAFIPNEPLLAAALEHDPMLLEHAFSRRVALASPVSLWAVLKTVAFTWQQDVLTEDAKRLFDLGKELYSRIGTMAEHAEGLRRSIESTVTKYNAFASSLEQRVLVTARRLDGLDESRVIGEPSMIEAQPKPLTQVEFSSD
jgi:DNA recombination protein RmuC